MKNILQDCVIDVGSILVMLVGVVLVCSLAGCIDQVLGYYLPWMSSEPHHWELPEGKEPGRVIGVREELVTIQLDRSNRVIEIPASQLTLKDQGYVYEYYIYSK